MADQVPSAIVQYWTASDVCIKCPYCRQTHHHGMSWPPMEHQPRRAHCGRGENYQLRFPDASHADVSGLAWEIDKHEQKIDTVSSDGRVYKQDVLSHKPDASTDELHISPCRRRIRDSAWINDTEFDSRSKRAGGLDRLQSTLESMSLEKQNSSQAVA